MRRPLVTPPKLFLAPMEGLGSRPFRKALAVIGGFDEASTEFISVPQNGHVKSLAKRYSPHDTYPIPQAAQIMGSSPPLMGAMAHELEKRGAHRIDLNCGCPSNTVTGHGAGSSLLKDPMLLHSIAKEMVASTNVPVTAKLRSGFSDTSLFQENLLAAQEAGVAFITLHPRTKVDGYIAPAQWSLIAEAKKLLSIPVIGNGDVKTPADAKRLLEETNCDGIMIGRGAVINPWIFHQIKASFGLLTKMANWEETSLFLTTFYAEMRHESREKNKVNFLKQLFSFLFQGTPFLQSRRKELLTLNASSAESFFQSAYSLYKEGVSGAHLQ